MRLLVSGASSTLRALAPAASDCLGILRVPAGGRALHGLEQLPWAADNGCFTGLDKPAYIRLLDRCAWAPSQPLWVTAPDIVGAHRPTLRLFLGWLPELQRRQLPVAFVAQDGATADNIPWGAIAAVFIGGSTAWKLGPRASKIVAAAKARGKLVHIGRVNSLRRLRYCNALGAHTVDGSKYSRWAAHHLPRAIRFLQEET